MTDRAGTARVIADDNRKSGSTVTVRLPRALINLFPGAEPMVRLSASTVGEVIDALDTRWPGMAHRLTDSRPAIRRHINVFVAGHHASLKTRLAPGSEITILTAISGG